MKRGYRISKKRLSLEKTSENRNKIKNIVDENNSFQKYLVNHDNYDIVVDRLVEEYNILEQNGLGERFCWMIEEYEYYPIEAYPELLNIAFGKMEEFFPETHKFNLLSILDSKSLSKNQVKSSNLVQYLYQSTFFRTFSSKSMTRKFNYRNGELRKSDGTPWVIVDDFVGTGKSFIESYLYWRKRGRIVDGALFLVATEDGINLIKQKIPEIKISCGKIVQNVCSVQEAEDFSESLGIRSGNVNYCTGALVTMARTPNNTIPIFYKKGNYRGNKVLPPFVR